MTARRWVGVLTLTFLSAACSDVPSVAAPALGTPPSVAVPVLDEPMISQGRELYLQYCSECHGADLQGDPDWRIPNADGSYRPPPQDATGHTWHHSDQLLLEIIGNGSGFTESAMPQFSSILTAEQILAILEFFKSNWGPEERQFQWQQTLVATP